MRRFFLVFSIILFVALIVLGIHQKINRYEGSDRGAEEIGVVSNYYYI